MSFNPLISLWKRAGLSLWDSDSVPCRNSMQGKPPVRKTTSGGKLGLRKTTPGGAARGAGDSCGSYTHCGFDAHDLRRGQQTRRPITPPDNRADARPSGSVHGYREIAAGAPRSPHRFTSSPYRGFDRAGNYSLEQGLPTFDGQKDTFRRPGPDWSTDPVKPWRNSPILVRPCKR